MSRDRVRAGFAPVLVVVALACASGPGPAAPVPSDGSGVDGAAALDTVGAAGAELRDARGRRAGRVLEVVLGADGRAVAATLEVRGAFGLGRREVTVSADELGRVGDAVRIDMTREELRAMAAHAE